MTFVAPKVNVTLQIFLEVTKIPIIGKVISLNDSLDNLVSIECAG